MKKRDLYLNQLIQYKDKPLIKVVTGIRRCGKSSLLSLFEEYLRNSGVHEDHVIRMNFESYEFDAITKYTHLHTYIKNKITAPHKKYYLILDEVQQVESWEIAINSFLENFNIDIYIICSNAYLLSSELSTLLSGQYVVIKMLPLSFKEYLDFSDFKKGDDLHAIFKDYLEFGGLPTIIELKDRPVTIATFLNGIYNTVIMKDVIQKNVVKDAALLESILKYIAANIGNTISRKKISAYLTDRGKKATGDTIENYLKMLEKAFIIYRANRYDLKARVFLKTLEKYYMVDIGLCNQLTGLRNPDYGHVLENIIYLELLRRGYDIAIGKAGTLEVDFIGIKSNKKFYCQVVQSVMDEEITNHKLTALQSITDHNPKMIITIDDTLYSDFDGVKIMNILDFLLYTK